MEGKQSKKAVNHDDYRFFSKKNWSRDRYLVLMMVPVVLYLIVFCYAPMAGLWMAFTQFRPGAGFRGIFTGKFIGLKWFHQFFHSIYAWRLVRNTFLLSFYSLIFGFPVPIIFAIAITQVKNTKVQKTCQVLTYLPYFISTVVICGMINNFLSPSSGIVNQMLVRLGHREINFLGEPQFFRAIYVISGSWQTFGFNSIIFVAAIMSIPQELYEAMDVDGAGKWTKVFHLILPEIRQTIVLLLIMAVGKLLNVGFEKVYLLYSPGIYETADVIQTYVYRQGIVNQNYGYASAVGLFGSMVSFAIVFIANRTSRKLSETSIW